MHLQTADKDLTEKITSAARSSFQRLFEEFDEDFYYCALITCGMALRPAVVAWSHQSLEREVQWDPDPDEARLELKWSYADSPYFTFADELFDEVEAAFLSRPQLTTNMSRDQWNEEIDVRMNSMVLAMKHLDQEGLFGSGEERFGVYVGVEVMPPDYTNTKRAWQLNPPEAIEAWLREAAETD